MNKKIAAALAVSFAAGALSCAGIKTAPAEASKVYHEFTQGASAWGVICGEDGTLVEAEGMAVLFDIPHFPQETYVGEEQFCKYGAHAVTRYTLYNPTDETVNVKLLLPFGRPPEYAVRYGENGKVVYGDNAHYRVSSEGKEISPAVRHSFHGDFYYFDAQEERKRLTDGFREDSFFSCDLPVTAYVYRVETCDYDCLVSSFGYNRAKTRVLLSSPANMRIENGCTKVSVSFDELKGKQDFTVYVFGEAPAEISEWRYVSAGGTEMTTELLAKETMTLGEFVEASRKEEYGVSRTDWYNAFIDCFNEARTDTCVIGSIEGGKQYVSLSRWYEYTLEIPAGGRIDNAVTSPVYPDIESVRDGSGSTYRYEYLLSAASCFADVGEFTITVRTPYLLSNSTLQFDAVQNGEYNYKAYGLPHGELAFTLSDGSVAAQLENGQMSLSLIVALVILGVIIAGAIGFAAAGFVLSKKKKKK